MKKNSGVSMISLVITIIVIIILAAVAFGSSTDTIDNANFSNFTNNVAEVQSLFQQQAINLKGQEGAKGVSRTDAQVYNFLATGATTIPESGEAWLSRADATDIKCTQLAPKYMKEAIDYELPTIKVATRDANSIECSYFVTSEGQVFVWPPYIHQNELYVNGQTKVMSGDVAVSPESGEVYCEDGDFKFNVGTVEVTVTTGDVGNIKYSETESPVGIVPAA